MTATIIAILKDGEWASPAIPRFVFALRDSQGVFTNDTLSLESIRLLATRQVTGPLFAMARAIEAATPDQYESLVGQTFS